jgi:tetratricopeptide (TPR) repeat protein
MNGTFLKALNPRYAKLRDQARLHVEGGSKDNALKSATAFYVEFPNDADANFNYSRALVRHGKPDVAIGYAEAANKLSPQNANCIFLLGRLYLDFQLYEFAAPLLSEAVELLPQNILIQWSMADFMLAVGNGEAAQTYYQKALDLGPDSHQRPELLRDFGRCLQSTATKSQADIIYQQLQKISGYETIALAMRSRLSKYVPSDDIAEQVASASRDDNFSAELKSDLLLSLGNIYDNAEEYDQAFQYWAKSRNLKEITREKDVGYAALATVIKFYSPSVLKQTAIYGHDSKLPLFVAGMPRSGTTLTEQIISSHSQAYGVGELGRMHKLEHAFRLDYAKANYEELLLKNAKNGELIARAEETLKLLKILARDQPTYVVDKMPSNYLSMGYTHLCFPNAKFIHCQRHPADSFISSYQNNMSQFHEYSFDQTLYAEAYLTKERLMDHWRSIFPEKIFDLKYERLVSQPEETVREMLEFIGLPWDANCMRFFEQAGTVKTFSQDQVRKPIYTTSVYRWKNYEKHLAPLFKCLKEAGYVYPEG